MNDSYMKIIYYETPFSTSLNALQNITHAGFYFLKNEIIIDSKIRIIDLDKGTYDYALKAYVYTNNRINFLDSIYPSQIISRGEGCDNIYLSLPVSGYLNYSKYYRQKNISTSAGQYVFYLIENDEMFRQGFLEQIILPLEIKNGVHGIHQVRSIAAYSFTTQIIRDP